MTSCQGQEKPSNPVVKEETVETTAKLEDKKQKQIIEYRRFIQEETSMLGQTKKSLVEAKKMADENEFEDMQINYDESVSILEGIVAEAEK